MADEESKQFVNVLMDEKLVAKLDEMVKADQSNRSVFIRRLIAREWVRQQPMPLPLTQQVEAA